MVEIPFPFPGNMSIILYMDIITTNFKMCMETMFFVLSRKFIERNFCREIRKICKSNINSNCSIIPTMEHRIWFHVHWCRHHCLAFSNDRFYTLLYRRQIGCIRFTAIISERNNTLGTEQQGSCQQNRGHRTPEFVLHKNLSLH